MSNLLQAVRVMNDLPDISAGDSPELKRLCEQSAREVKLIGSISASTSLEMIAHMRQLEETLRGESDNYVAWCRYTYDESGGIKSIVTCNSNAKGAFKVWRH
jgi:hypothetical protein